jgi:hypothetical protein
MNPMTRLPFMPAVLPMGCGNAQLQHEVAEVLQQGRFQVPFSGFVGQGAAAGA